MYTVYETTNNVNGKTYIGVHKTNVVNDSYLGSGKLIKAAIAKHGTENFSKQVLFCYDDKEQAYQKERELVTPEMLLNRNCYNIKHGGEGGFDYVNANGLGSRSGIPMGKLAKAAFDRTGTTHSPQTKEKIRNATMSRISDIAHNSSVANTGVPKTAEHKQKIAESVRLAHKRRIESLVDCNVANVV